MPLGANKAAIMGVAGVSTVSVVLLSSQTETGVTEIDFTSGITSTYGEYIFRCYNINPSTDSADLKVQFNVAGESGFNETITSTHFQAYKGEADETPSLGYGAAGDQAEGTAYQYLLYDIGNGADESGAGELHLFNPASTTYVKHFYGSFQMYHVANYSQVMYTAGYVNVTGAIDEVSFKISTGNFDGTIKMWGVK
jgi:hypothetical protein